MNTSNKETKRKRIFRKPLVYSTRMKTIVENYSEKKIKKEYKSL